GVARALAALGPFYTDAQGLPGGGLPPGGEPGPHSGALGYMEEAGCLLASAACLAQQGQLGNANQLLSRALKTSHRRLGHTQLVCAVLGELAPTFLAQRDAHPALEALTSAATFSRTAGDLWAEAAAKRKLATIFTQQADGKKAAEAAASAGRREQRIAAATAAALADSGRHGYAAGWGLRTVG
ncbi:hypothetical protein Agub_g5177, partial [Astrephomene gubernaculifera]